MSADPKSHPISSLSDAQQRTLRNACKHMDGLLKDVEAALDTSRTSSVFPKYINDIASVQRKTIEEYLVRFRVQLLRVLAGQAIELEEPRIKASHAIHTSLTFIEIAIEELSPGRMRGYGPVSKAAVVDLNNVIQDLQAIMQELHGYVLQGSAPDQSQRVDDSGITRCNIGRVRRKRRQEKDTS
jgi:hypothetical protein